MTLESTLTIGAIIIGPILAVQAQKLIETINERRRRKIWVFHQLMSTRAIRLAPDHVQALNMIDLAFYGNRIRRSNGEQGVLDAWHEYLDHLTTKSEDIKTWFAKGDELFTNLLYAISVELRYRFDRVQLKKGVYSPVAHGDLEQEINELRRLSLSALRGESALKLDVVSLPIDKEAIQSQIALQQKVVASYAEDGSVRVRLSKPVSERPPTQPT